MPTKSDSDFVIEFPPTVEARLSGAAKVPDSGVYVDQLPSSSNNFVFYGKAKNRKGWLYLSDALQSMRWTDDLETGCVTGSAELDNRELPDGTRLADKLPNGSELRLMYLPENVPLESVEQNSTGLIEVGRFVLWDRTRASGGIDTMSITFYDHMKYLIESEITVLFSNRGKPWSATEMTKRICKEQGIAVGNLPKTKGHIDYFYQESTSIFETLVKIWTREFKKSGNNFHIFMQGGKLQVVQKAKKPKGKVLELRGTLDGGVLLSGSFTESMEGMRTSARFYGTHKDTSEQTGDSRAAVIAGAPYKNKKAVAQYGRIHHEETLTGVETKSRLNKSAKQYVAKKSVLQRSGSVSVIGMPWLRAGMAVRINDPGSGLIGPYWFKQLDHSIDGSGSYLCQGEVRRYDYTLNIGTNKNDLQGDLAAAGSGAGDADLTAGTNTTKMPDSIFNMIKRAAPEAGVPVEWAASNSLAELLQHESGFSPTAHNSGSGAYGLFQFLTSTWSGTSVAMSWATPKGYAFLGEGGHFSNVTKQQENYVYWQCVAGLRYIKNRYTDPDAAWTFWQARVPINGKDVGNWY